MTAHALRLAPIAAAALLAACALPGPRLARPTVSIPASLDVPPRLVLQRTLWADGVQVYECRRPPDGGFPAWELVAPDAVLKDSGGAVVGRHFAGPTWEAADGSKVAGVVKARVDAPGGRAIPWLLLETHAIGGPGQFAAVTAIQRVATTGGLAPATGCGTATLGRQERVPYTAQYALYVPAP